MPGPIPWWTAEHDARLLALREEPGMTLQKLGAQMGVSRSYAQRRLHELRMRRPDARSAERSAAGKDPLPPMHPIAWQAIDVMHALL